MGLRGVLHVPAIPPDTAGTKSIRERLASHQADNSCASCHSKIDPLGFAKTDPAGVSAKPNAMVLFNPGIGGAKKDGSPDPRDPEGKYDLRNYVKPGQPPAIIFHGKDDTVVPFASAEAFTEVMKKAGNSCELVGYEGAGHSFFNEDKYYELTIAETDRFLVGLGWLEKKAGTKYHHEPIHCNSPWQRGVQGPCHQRHVPVKFHIEIARAESINYKQG